MKLLIIRIGFCALAACLISAAWTVQPPPAKASGPIYPIYYVNGLSPRTGEPIPTVSWGTLNLASGGTTVTCQNAELGTVENVNLEHVAKGVSETIAYSSSNCALSTGECKPSQGLEVVVTPEELPWGAELEPGVLNGGGTVRDRTVPAAPGTPGLTGSLFASTVGTQLTTHCVFRGTQAGVKETLEEICGRAFPATSHATVYNPSTREVEAIAADGFAALVIEEETACSEEGLAFEEAEIAARPSTPGDPAKYDVPGVAVAPCDGESAPHLKNGTSDSKPTEILFDQNGNSGGEAENDTTGTLECEGEGPGDETGSLDTEDEATAAVVGTKAEAFTVVNPAATAGLPLTSPTGNAECKKTLEAGPKLTFLPGFTTQCFDLENAGPARIYIKNEEKDPENGTYTNISAQNGGCQKGVELAPGGRCTVWILWANATVKETTNYYMKYEITTGIYGPQDSFGLWWFRIFDERKGEFGITVPVKLVS